MYEHISYHPEWAKQLHQEIVDDNSDWFHPKGTIFDENDVGDFDYGRMRFINRNLNYFYFDNMLSHAVKNEFDFNTKYPKFLEFCEIMRNLNNETGPYGRMCIWKLQARSYLIPHRDNWEYHRHITRYIFCISDHHGSDVLIKICDKEIPVTPGLVFNFFPATDLHEFVNNTDRDFYFLGWDYWQPDKLNSAIERTGITRDTIIPYDTGYGGHRRKTKFMSKE